MCQGLPLGHICSCACDCLLTYARSIARRPSLRQLLPLHAPWKGGIRFVQTALTAISSRAKKCASQCGNVNTSQIQPLGVPTLQGPGLRSVPNSSCSTPCKVCQNAKYLLAGVCLDSCPAGHYGIGGSATSRTCHACPEKCSECAVVSGNEVGCSGCKGGYFLLQRDHTCVPSCPGTFMVWHLQKLGVTQPGQQQTALRAQVCCWSRGSQSSLSGCTKCEPGKYAGGGDKASCEFCPRGWHGLDPGDEVLMSGVHSVHSRNMGCRSA